MDTLYFYAKHDPYGEFSNFAPFGIEMDKKWWATVEHYFQAQKFSDETYREKIRACRTPREAATLGRARTFAIRSDWEKVKDEIMFGAVLKKFQTHATLREMLVETGECRIVENSPNDYYWGGGQDGTGLNTLGNIIMLVRQELR